MFNSNMKLFFFCLTVSLCALLTIPIMAESPDLAGYWNFNGNTLDRSGNDNSGTVSGTTAYNTAGKVGKAFDFNNSTSIDFGNASSLNIADNISVEYWFYPRAWVSGYAVQPFSKWASTADANYVMYFFGNTAGGAYKMIGFYANAGGTWKSVSPLYLIPALNTWYHIVWTYNSTSGGKLYVNGALYGSPTGSGILTTNTAHLNIGASGFNGLFDEAKIYNRVLSSSDVTARYQAADVRGYWNFHYNTLDFSGNDNSGTVSGTTAYNTAGKVGKAFDFNNSTSIDFGNASSLNIADNISVEYWFYPRAWVSDYAVQPFSKWTGTADANYVMYFFGPGSGTDKMIGFYANAGGTWKAVSPLYLIPSLNTWYHIVWTYNSTSGGKLYVNGALYGSPTGSGTLATNTAPLNIGASGFNGLVDEAKIYNRVLSSSDVTARYQDLGVYGAVLENDTLQLTVNAAGMETLLRKPSGQDCGGGQGYFAWVRKSGVWYTSSSCLQKNGRLMIDFGSANVTAEITTKTAGSYFVFQVYSVYGDTTGIEKFMFLDMAPPLNTYCDEMSGIRGDDTFTLALRAMNARADIVSNFVFPCIVDTAHGASLAKFGLLGSSTSNIRAAFKTMLTSEGLLRTSQGGPWALDVPESKSSYMFVTWITPTDVNALINLANGVGSKILHFFGWWTSTGHYVPRSDWFPNGLADMKTCVDAIHAAGLKASMHCMTGFISTNDSYVTPLADSRLYKDARFTLASAIGTTDTTINVNEQPASILNNTGQVLQIGNELITYTGYTQTTPYRFTGCTRGAYSTTKQSQIAGKSVGHLFMYINSFFPDPDSTLVKEMAANLASVFNYCGFDMIYLDGAEAGDSYQRFKMAIAIINSIGRSVRIETSYPTNRFWTFYSNVGAWDFPYYGVKRFIDNHVQYVADFYKTKLLPCQLGWWYFMDFTEDTYAQFPDEVEYLGAKALGCDAALSFEYIQPFLSALTRQDEFLQIIKGYEDLRAAGTVSDAVKAQLKTPGSEFHLTSSGNIIRRDNLVHKVTSLSDGSNSWTVNNRFSTQTAKFRIQALHSDLTASYNNGPNISLDDFQNAGNFALTNASNVTSSLSVNGGICTYTATNNTATPVGAWTKASKTFSPGLNISGGYDTLGVWVNGDNRGEVLNFQLYSGGAYDDHYVVVNFSGWKYFELFLRERDADKYENYLWPYDTAYVNVYSFSLAKDNIPNLNIYYNNLPVGQQASCQIRPVKALLTAEIGISNPSINVNGTTITFPFTLQSGQYIEFYSMSDCRVYNNRGALITSITPIGTVPALIAGNNNVTFNGTGTAGYNTRANITMIIDGTQIYP